MNKRILIVILIILVSAAFVGCTKKNVRVILSEKEYILKLENEFNRKKYDNFREDAKYFIADFPGSSGAPRMQFLIGESFFNKKKFEESIAAYQRVIDKYPTSEFVDDSYFRIGEAYFRRMSMSERDQTATEKAMYYFEKVVRMDSEYVDQSAEYIKECRNNLGMKEYFTARFYVKTGHNDVALDIIDKTLREYNDTDAAYMLNYLKAYIYYKEEDKDKAAAVIQAIDSDELDEKMVKKLTKLTEKIRKLK